MQHNLLWVEIFLAIQLLRFEETYQTIKFTLKISCIVKHAVSEAVEVVMVIYYIIL